MFSETDEKRIVRWAITTRINDFQITRKEVKMNGGADFSFNISSPQIAAYSGMVKQQKT